MTSTWTKQVEVEIVIERTHISVAKWQLPDETHMFTTKSAE